MEHWLWCINNESSNAKKIKLNLKKEKKKYYEGTGINQHSTSAETNKKEESREPVNTQTHTYGENGNFIITE